MTAPALPHWRRVAGCNCLPPAGTDECSQVDACFDAVVDHGGHSACSVGTCEECGREGTPRTPIRYDRTYLVCEGCAIMLGREDYADTLCSEGER